jgi:hypothetical protein
MQTMIIRIASVACVVAVLIGIKMMDLPGLITSVLVVVMMSFIIFNVVIFPGKKDTHAGK